MPNIKFIYLYRDGGNYKKWAEVVFSNPVGLSLASISGALRSTFTQDGLFVAHQVRLPEAFLYTEGNATSDDHCFHEFDEASLTIEAPNDPHQRSISQFLAEVQSQANRGWLAFDPHDRREERALDQ